MYGPGRRRMRRRLSMKMMRKDRGQEWLNETTRWGGGPFRGGGMLLYFGSRGIMPQANACLCDVDHIYPFSV
jgi:hypothetical protein